MREWKVLVCGGRDYADRDTVFYVLDRLLKERGLTCVIEGGARGADRLAASWASARGVSYLEFPAEWDRYGKSAGIKRNTRMLLEGKPAAVVAFPGGAGTANMVLQAKRAGLPVWKPVK